MNNNDKQNRNLENKINNKNFSLPSVCADGDLIKKNSILNNNKEKKYAQS